MKRSMRKASALPIRLDTEQKESLSRIAEETGLSVSALVRMLVQSFVDEYDRNGGRVCIPPQWRRETNYCLAAEYQEQEKDRPRKAAEPGPPPSAGTYRDEGYSGK